MNSGHAQNYSYLRFAQDGDLDEFIHEILDSTFQQVHEVIDNNHIATLDIPLATEMAMQKLLSIVNLAMFPHDGTPTITKETSSESNQQLLPLEYFQPDPEPTPSPIDNWARGASKLSSVLPFASLLFLLLTPVTVPTRHIQPLEDPLFNLQSSKSDGTRTPSVSSMRSSRTGSSKTSSLASSRTGALSRHGTNRGGGIGGIDNSPKIIELDESNSLSSGHGNGNGSLNTTNHLYDMLQKQNNRLKKFTQVDDETRDEFELLQEQLSRTSAELGRGGKRFAVDSTGKAIGIAPIKSETLPPYSLFPSHTISNAASAPAAASTAAAGGAGGKRGPRKRVSKDQSSASTDASAASLSPSYPHFLPTPSLATSLSSAHSSLPLAPGVTLKSKLILETPATAAGSATTGGGATASAPVTSNKATASLPSPIVREGPHLPSDPKKLSRAEYFAKQQQQTQTLSRVTSTSGGGPGDGFGGGSSFGEMSRSEYSLTSNPSPTASTAVPSRLSSRGGGAGGGMSGTGTGTGGVTRYLDLNPLEGGREIDHKAVAKAEEELRKAKEEEQQQTLQNTQHNHGVGRVNFNTATGAAAVPQKPTGKQKEIVGQLHGSQYLAGPRDRLATHTLDSRRKHTQPQQSGGGTSSGGVGEGGMSMSLLSADPGTESEGSFGTGGRGGRGGGGSVKRERADLAREIFR